MNVAVTRQVSQISGKLFVEKSSFLCFSQHCTGAKKRFHLWIDACSVKRRSL